MKKLFFLLLIVSASVPSTGQTPVTSKPGEWRQFRGNARLTGVAEGALPAAPKTLWTYDTGDTIASSAAIADG